MEIRALRCFLSVVEHQGVSAAAQAQGVPQSTLSRQLQALEREVGGPLFVRGNRGRRLSLTRRGRMLYRRALEIVALADRTEHELSAADAGVTGEIHIGAAECMAMLDVCRVMTTIRERHPNVCFHVHSGNGPDVIDWLDRGMVDFAVLIEPVDLSRFDHLRLPMRDRKAVLVRRDHPLAALDRVTPGDLAGFPVIASEGSLRRNDLSGWLGGGMERLNVVGTCNLVQNAALMVEAGYGVMIGLDVPLVGVSDELCLRPLYPQVDVRVSLVWLSGRPLSEADELFVETLRDAVAGQCVADDADRFGATHI